jgi:hypothetical protein
MAILKGEVMSIGYVNGKTMMNCDLCGNAYQHGQGTYLGHKLELYGDLSCCDVCWRGNWDGWTIDYERKLLAHLKSQNLPIPVRNQKGWLPRN